MAPSCAVAPAPMVAAKAMAAVAGAIIRTLKKAEAKPVKRLHADLGEVVVALHRNQRAGGHRQEADDRDGSADHRERPCAQAHLGDEPQQLDPIVDEDVADDAQRGAVELRLMPDPIPAVDPAVDSRADAGTACRSAGGSLSVAGGHSVTFTATAVATTLIANNAMKVNTTVSFTALPTPAGPPPTEMPL